MRPVILSLLVICHFSTTLSAQTVDKVKLRAALRPPKPVCDPGAPAWVEDETEKSKKTVAYLEAELTGTLSDAVIYQAIARQHRAMKNGDAEEEARLKVEELAKPHLGSKDPKHARVLAAYSDSLLLRRPYQLDRSEQYARQALKLDPEDWLCWNMVGCNAQARCFQTMLGDPDRVNGAAQLAEFIRAMPPIAPARLQTAERSMREMRRCRDRIEDLASNDPNALNACIRLDTALSYAFSVLAHQRGQQARDEDLLPSSFVRCTQALADRVPDAWQVQSKAALLTLSEIVVKDKSEHSPSTLAQRQKALKPYVDRLEGIADEAEPKKAITILLNLANIHEHAKDFAASVQCCKDILRLDPEHAVKDFLVINLMRSGKNAEALARARDNHQIGPTPTNSYLLARALDDNGNATDAEKLLREVVKTNPDDLRCRLGLAYMLLVHSDNQTELNEAGDILNDVGKTKSLSLELWLVCARLQIGRLALQGLVSESLGLFPQIPSHWPEDAEEMRKLRAAFSPAME